MITSSKDLLNLGDLKCCGSYFIFDKLSYVLKLICIHILCSFRRNSFDDKNTVDMQNT